MAKHFCDIEYEQFYDMYIVQNLTCSEIAKITGFTKDQILYRKSKLKITKSQELFKQCMSRISSSEEFVNSVKATNMRKYGVEYAAQIPGAMDKRVRTNLEKYGVENVMQLPENIEKQQNTNIQRYGGTSPMANPIIGQKRVNTVQDKYGVDNVFQSHEIKKKMSRRYYYDNERFDSSWELALWIYAKDHNENIVREPCRITYVFNNQKHYYFPDFSYKGQLIEIKGPHLLQNNKFTDIYNQSERSLLYEAKRIDMLNRGIIIWGEAEIRPYLLYIKEKYGKDYLKQYKGKRLDNTDTDCIIDLDF